MQKFNSPLEAFLHWEKNTPDNIFLRQPFNRNIKESSYEDAGNEIRRIANALLSLDMEPKSKVALISKNCSHWIMADLAIMMAGHISVPIYPTLNSESIRQILEHSDSKAVFVGKLDNYEAQKSGIPDIHKIGIKAYDIEEDLSWEDLVSKNDPLEDVHTQVKDDMLTFIYTSGTTGAPKGVMHTVDNVSQVANNAIDILPIEEHPRFFSFLPLSHVAERVAIELHGIYKGAIFNFPESLATFAEDLEAARPHLFFAVPRIYAKFQEKILEKMPQEKLSKLLRIPILGGIIRKKIVKKLGLYNATYIASGAAPIAQSLQEWFSKLGVIIHQDYGMTEDCILSHYNLVGSNKMGTVGRAIPGVTRKLSPEGEICIKSDALMKGYYKEPELTAEMFDDEGFLKTGDIGEYDHDGFLTITGRVKDQFKTDKGKYISPAPIELELLKNPYIEQICIVGMGIPQPIALIITSLDAKSKSDDEVNNSLNQSINELNPSLEKYERLEKAVIMREDWSVDNGLLTPTLKVKRNQVEKIHMPMYKEWFEHEAKVIYE
jgi:long-chain acyl-CoA synthetase